MSKQLFARVRFFQNIEGKEYEAVTLMTNTYVELHAGNTLNIKTDQGTVIIEIKDDPAQFIYIDTTI